MLLLRQPTTGPGPTSDEMREIMDKFMMWMKGMADREMIVGTNRLDDHGIVLRGPGGSVSTDGPFAESKEIIGGYVLIQARSLAQAVEAARECPGLNHRMTVEVRSVKAPPSDE